MKKFILFILSILILFLSSACKSGATASSFEDTGSSNVLVDDETDYNTVTSQEDESSSSEESSLLIPQTSSNSSVNSTENTFNPLKEYRKNYNFGSNKKLEGNITVHCFFVNDNSSSWTVLFANWFVDTQIKHALSFLENEAEIYKKSLRLTPKYYIDNSTSNTKFISKYSMKYDGVIDCDISDGIGTEDLINVIAKNMGYSNGIDLSQSLKNETNSEHIFLFFINKQGRSYSWYASDFDSNYAESNLIFSLDEYSKVNGVKSEYTSLTIVHEILHNYGAEDFYLPEKRKELAQICFPNDVMLKIDPPVRTGDIGELTAFQIGWINTVPDICSNIYWW